MCNAQMMYVMSPLIVGNLVDKYMDVGFPDVHQNNTAANECENQSCQSDPNETFHIPQLSL